MEASNILIVEDEVITAMELQDNLQKFGFNAPLVAATGEDAIRMADEMKPDLILMDIVLKGQMDGIDAAEHIKQQHKSAVVFLTAYNDDKTFSRAKKCVPYGYLSKPFKSNELRATLELALLRRQMDLATTERINCYDVLTGLPNRKSFSEKLKVAIAKEHGLTQKVAVLVVNLDQFNLVNYRLGHAIGDKLLKIVAKRLEGEVKSKDVIARIGGDDFAILVQNVANKSDAAKIASRILKAFSRTITIEDYELNVSCSIGISLFPDNGGDEETLLKDADIAMRHAKEIGRNNFQFCTSEIVDSNQQKANIANRLQQALLEEKFAILYQPQIDIRTGKIIGVEALLRLQDEDGNLILPNKFIPVAEETGLIVPVSDWVLYHACYQFQSWNSILADQSVKLAVNLSARQLLEPRFLDNIIDTLKKLQFPPEKLELEITENPIISDIESSAEILRQLKRLGISIALDDFGIGYSSLNYFRQFDIDTLKIDQSLIKNLITDKTDSKLIISIINLAHSLQIDVIAEGAETEDQIQFLLKSGCTKAQCNYFSVPLTADEMKNFILNPK